MTPFRPILAGATLRDRERAAIGGVIGIALTSLLSWLLIPSALAVPLLVAPMGASAVLVFAVPASPLAQPWPVVGGNTVSALVGVAVAKLVPVPHLAAGLAAGLAILLMSLTRCLHPPGGAAALTAVIGGPAVAKAGFLFPFVPVALNAVLLVAAGLLFHRLLSGHSYPHRPIGLPPMPQTFVHADIEKALADLGETFDVAPEDLEQLLARAEHHAGERIRARSG